VLPGVRVLYVQLENGTFAKPTEISELSRKLEPRLAVHDLNPIIASGHQSTSL
jgi:hypothetical protein